MKITKTISISLAAIFVFFNFSYTNAANHDFTGLPLTSDGWTDFEIILQTGYEDARVIFVSNSEGDDSTGQIYDISNITFDSNGMFQPQETINAYKTIAAGYAQIRDNSTDILLLKRGDEWEERFSSGSVGYWNKSGRSNLERTIVASYGSGDRPLLLVGASSGFISYAAINWLLSGVRIYSHTWESTTTGYGIDINGALSGILVEDCVFDRGVGGVRGGFSQVAFRRNQFLEGHPNELTAKIWAIKGVGLLLEENTFYSPVEGNRHLYLSPEGVTSEDPDNTLTGVELRRNFFYVSQRTGLSLRAGGIIDNNTIIKNDMVLLGGAGGSQDSVQSGFVNNNVFLEATPDYFSRHRGDGENGILIQNIDGGSANGNIFTDATGLSGDSLAFMIKGDVELQIAKNIEIKDNVVYNRANGTGQHRCLSTSGELLEVQNVVIRDNDFQMNTGADSIILHRAYSGGVKRFEEYFYSGNRYYSSSPENTWFSPGETHAGWTYASGETGSSAGLVTYPHPERNLKTYNASLGGNASTEEFMLEVLKQSRQNWRPAYTACATNNYVREGFGKEEVPCWTTTVVRADVDGSSQINTTDALLTLRNSLGLSMNGTAWQASATTGDVNCDGVSNSTDALLVLRYSLGLPMSGTGWCE